MVVMMEEVLAVAKASTVDVDVAIQRRGLCSYCIGLSVLSSIAE
jgi:hypothetical protein